MKRDYTQVTRSFGVCALLLTLAAGPVFAEDGLVLRFTIDEWTEHEGRRQSYTDGVLMRFDEQVSIEFDQRYVVGFTSQSLDEGRVNVVVTLADIIDGKPYHVDSKPIEFEVGEERTIEMRRGNVNYKLAITSAYGSLPE